MNSFLTLSILFFTFASPAFAAITIVQHTNNDAFPTSVLDVGLHQNTGSRNLLVVMIMVNPGNYSVVSVSDGYNFFTAVPNTLSVDATDTERTEAWYLPYSTSGANTIEVIFSGVVPVFTSMEVWEVSGYKAPVVDMAGAVQNAVGAEPGETGAAVTTTQAAEFIAACDESSDNAGTSSNFTSGGEQDGGDNDYASLITTTAGTYQPLWPNDNGYTSALSTVAFKDMPGRGLGGTVKINNGKIGF
jgi:hypothetical protein